MSTPAPSVMGSAREVPFLSSPAEVGLDSVGVGRLGTAVVGSAAGLEVGVRVGAAAPWPPPVDFSSSFHRSTRPSS